MRTSRTLISAIGDKLDVLFRHHNSINSNKALAQALAIAPANVSQWRRGVLGRGVSPGYIPQSRLLEMARLFGIDCQWFYKEFDEFEQHVKSCYSNDVNLTNLKSLPDNDSCVENVSHCYSPLNTINLNSLKFADENEVLDLSFLFFKVKPVTSNIDSSQYTPPFLALVESIAKQNQGLLVQKNMSLSHVENHLPCFEYDWLFCFGYLKRNLLSAAQCAEFAFLVYSLLPNVIDSQFNAKSFVFSQKTAVNSNTVLSEQLTELDLTFLNELPDRRLIVNHESLPLMGEQYQFKAYTPPAKTKVSGPFWSIMNRSEMVSTV